MSTFGICLVLIALLYTETDSRKPNVVFVLTDDQDVMLGGQVKLIGNSTNVFVLLQFTAMTAQ